MQINTFKNSRKSEEKMKRISQRYETKEDKTTSEKILIALKELKDKSNDQVLKETMQLIRSSTSSRFVRIRPKSLFEMVGGISGISECVIDGSDNINESKAVISFIKMLESMKHISTKIEVLNGVAELIFFEFPESDQLESKSIKVLNLATKTLNRHIKSRSKTPIIMEYKLGKKAQLLYTLVDKSKSPELNFKKIMRNLPVHFRSTNQMTPKLRTENAQI